MCSLFKKGENDQQSIFEVLTERIDSIEMKLDTYETGSSEKREETEKKMEEMVSANNEKIKVIEQKILDIETILKESHENYQNMSNMLENVLENIYDFESRKRNNLIFYGVPSEDYETTPKLFAKIKDIMKNQFQIFRTVHVSSVSRMYTGDAEEKYLHKKNSTKTFTVFRETCFIQILKELYSSLIT